MNRVRKCLAQSLASLGTALPALLTAGTLAPAHADQPVLHRVTYSVSADQSVHADIYFRDIDPPNWDEYSHNPYQFSPKVEADVGPNTRWTRDVMLADPDQWAMVTATSGPSPSTPRFHCQLAVDGTVVASGDGAKGALCSLRHW